MASRTPSSTRPRDLGARHSNTGCSLILPAFQKDQKNKTFEREIKVNAASSLAVVILGLLGGSTADDCRVTNGCCIASGSSAVPLMRMIFRRLIASKVHD